MGGIAIFPAKPAAKDGPDGLFAFQRCKDVARERLGRSTLKLFTQLTGLHLSVIWHGPLDFRRAGRFPSLCPCAAQWRRERGSSPTNCPAILRADWNPAERGGCFTGACGAETGWAGLQIGTLRPVTLVVQSAGDGAMFKPAVTLMEIILHDVESTIRADLARRELALMRQAVVRQSQQSAPTCGGPPSALPGNAQGASADAPLSHRRQVVKQALDYLQLHYQRPLQLGDVAAALKMNSSYLSTLFSQTQGVNFHKCLEDLRLAKARELLRDPAHRICEVACAVGYASANHFRGVFKAREGVSPAAWRARPPSASAMSTP